MFLIIGNIRDKQRTAEGSAEKARKTKREAEQKRRDAETARVSLQKVGYAVAVV